MTSKLRVKAIYRHIYIYIGKAWEWRLKAYSTLVLDRWTVLFSVHGTVVSLRITVLSVNLSCLGQRTQFLLEPVSGETGKTNHRLPWRDISKGLPPFLTKAPTAHLFRHVALNTPNRRGGQTVTGKLKAQYSNHRRKADRNDKRSPGHLHSVFSI